MQKFMAMSRKPGIQLVACLKNMASMDIAERRSKPRWENSKKI